MRNQYKHIKKNQDGAILVIVMMALTVLSLLGLALATVSFANIKLTTVDRDYQATYYVAEGGANQTYAEIKTLVESLYETSSTEASFYSDFNSRIDQQLDGTSISDFEKSFTEQPTAKVKVEQLTEGNPRSYQIVSEGIIGKRTRTVTKPFQVNWKSGSGSGIEIPDNAVAIVKNSISLYDGASISGDVYVDSSNSETIVMKDGSSIKNGMIYVPENAVDKAIKTPVDKGITIPEVKVNSTTIPWENYQAIIADFPTYPTYAMASDETIGGEYQRFNVIEEGNLNINSYQAKGYTLNLDKNIQFNRMTFRESITLNINTNNEDHDIVVKNLDLSNDGGHINIVGSGKVNIYIQDTFKIENGSINRDGLTNQLNMYYKGSIPLEISGGQSVNGSIFVKNAAIKLADGGSFKGFLVSGGSSVEYKDGAYLSSFVLAPFADVVLKDGANITGTIIANKLEGSDGGSATFNASNLDDFPFGSSSSSSPSTDDLIKKQPTVESD